MTPTNREIDAEVATKIMGWKREGNLWIGVLNGQHHVENAEGIDDIYQPEPAWSPSSSISDAFTVVDQVQRMNPGWRFSLLGGDMQFGWHAEFFGHSDPRLDYGQRHGTAYAATREMAICLAALAAVEKKG